MSRRALLPARVLAAMLVFAGTAAACASEPAPGADASAAVAYFVTEGGDLVRWSEGAVFEAIAEGLLPPSSSREAAYDARSGLLWYSDDHARIASISVETRRPGPSIGGFSDVALVGCAVTGRPRTLAIDTEERRLLVPQLTGGVLEYGLEDLSLEGAIPESTFGEMMPGVMRQIVIAPGGHLWFISVDGSLVEVDRNDGPTGRRLVLEQPIGAVIGDGTTMPVVRTEGGDFRLLDGVGTVRQPP